ncbi:non-intrinsic ABC protein 11 [Actinidia rufa]|uniref:Non-intrinsic ABC protein 11 n=1 Tax=Actinidia rufa TaxID=165716 RepID=A0A7J0E6M7_9ERIC|nr:non-intrinsic ABC protein 11 [Actinidia rufa]
MVSLAGSVFSPLNIWNGSAHQHRFSDRRVFIGSSSSYGHRMSVCACIASRNLRAADGFSAPKFNDSCNLENLNAVQEIGDESDVLIECKRCLQVIWGETHLERCELQDKAWGSCWNYWAFWHWKSTILKIMAGLLAPDKGEVFIRGKKRHDLTGNEEISGLRIGLVFQSAALFDSLTVRENVGFLLYENSSMSDDQIAALVTETLASVGLKVQFISG